MLNKPSRENNSFLSRYKTHILAIFLIIILGFAVYANSLNGGFLWDDEYLIENNHLIKHWNNLFKIFARPLTQGFYTYYRPLVNLSFMLDYHIWKLNPYGYHLTNVFLHILNACLVYLLIYALSRNQKLSVITGLIFCVHTILTEPVNYISSRGVELQQPVDTKASLTQ